MFSVGESDKKFIKSVKKLVLKKHLPVESEDNICHLEDECRGRTFHHTEAGYTIIRFKKKPTTCEEFGTVSHEIFHAVDFIFQRIGVSLCLQSGESYAYLIGYITEQFYSKLI